MSEAPARHLSLAGASNFRDLGGYPARNGRIVRWRQIFRSNHLGHLTDDDIAVVRGLGVRSAFDFRGAEERQAALCLMNDVTVHSLEDRAPLVIHCTAGKDRTGFACALILHTLGVSDDVIAEDYLLTNRYYRRDPNSGSDLPDDVKQVLGSVQPSFLGAAFEAIDADYGDLENYLR